MMVQILMGDRKGEENLLKTATRVYSDLKLKVRRERLRV